jgi:hypothetical protein
MPRSPSFRNNLDKVEERASEAIHLPYNKSIALLEIGENRVQPPPSCGASADAMVGKDSSTACCFKRVAL